ncbi:hypothetical protein BJX64DRAFT_294876 [Aspergillus heterothallicus]
MNGKKGVFFGGNAPKDEIPTGSRLNDAMVNHKKTAGVFSYMKISTVWDKFKTSSKRLEKHLATFDASYWSQQTIPAGALVRPNRQGAGLRELYCYWIDMELVDIEARAAEWHRTAIANTQAEFGKRGEPWVKTLKQGVMSKSTLKFLRAGSPRHGTTGTWAQSNYNGLWTGPVGPF